MTEPSGSGQKPVPYLFPNSFSGTLLRYSHSACISASVMPRNTFHGMNSLSTVPLGRLPSRNARARSASVSLPQIAERAGVARSTVYTIFGSREGLMIAVAEDLLERGGFARIGRSCRSPRSTVMRPARRRASTVVANRG